MYRPMTQEEIDAWDERETQNAGCVAPDSQIRENPKPNKELSEWNDSD